MLARLFELYPDLPSDTTLASYVQPPTRTPSGVMQGEVANFVLASTNPRNPVFQVGTRGSVYLKAFRESDRFRGHFVGVPDPVTTIVNDELVRVHLRKLKNLRELLD